jgi:hypothetical protein
MTLRGAFTSLRVRALPLVGMVVGVALLAGVASPVYGEGKRAVRKDTKKQIEKLEDEWRDAQLTGNVAEKLLSEAYFGISMTGQVNTKQQQLDRIRNRTLVLSKIDLSDVKIKMMGSTAVVTSRAEIEGTNEGVPITGGFRYTRVYQRTPGGVWQITNFEATRLVQPDGRRDRAAAGPRP